MLILRGMLNGEGKLLLKIDGKVRKLGDRQRLDTSLFLTVNDANQALVKISAEINE